MRKSIYYLIATILSTIAAAIFMLVVDNQFPFFSLGNLVVNGMSQNCWEPMEYILPVVALSIIYVTRDIVTHANGAKDTVSDKVMDIIMCILTIVTILFTWFAAILEYDNYAINVTISLPIIYYIYFVVALVALFVAPIINKINQNLGATLPFAAILIAVGGIINECLPYWYTTVSVVGVILLVVIIPLFLSLRKR